MKMDLKRQIMNLFQSKVGSRGILLTTEPLLLAEACLVIDVIGSEARRHLINWYCDIQLRDYKTVFRGNIDLATLEGIPKRYAWLERLLTTFERDHSIIFPSDWYVEEALCINFCAITNKDIADILKAWEGKIEANILLVAIRNTQAFENHIQSICNGKRKSKMISEEVRQSLTMSFCFEPYLFHFVDLYESELMEHCSGSWSTSLQERHFDSNNLLSSSTELFIFFKDQLNELITFSNRKPLLDLAATFSKFLENYSKYIGTILKKYGTRNSKNELGMTGYQIVCMLVNTVDYCIITTQQLEGRISQLIEDKLRPAVSFDSVIQSFHV